MAERRHTAYDGLLGWVNIPNVTVEDIYGPGLSLSTNSQSFRNGEDFTVNVPAGKVRIICSGNSFTLGYEVAENQTWCEQLRQEDPRFETVDMGQGGYGIDQAYLWYARDGVVLDHDIQVLAVITDDFLRAGSNHFSGYPKPLLQVDDSGKIVVTGVPVSRSTFHEPYLFLQRTQTAKLVRGIAGKLQRGSGNGRLQALASAILSTLQQLNAEKHSLLVVVYLPTISDYTGESSDPWRAFLAKTSASLGIAFVDLVEVFRQLPPMDVHGMFIQPGTPRLPRRRGALHGGR